MKGGINVDEIRVGSQDWGFMGIIKVNDLNKATWNSILKRQNSKPCNDVHSTLCAYIRLQSEKFQLVPQQEYS